MNTLPRTDLGILMEKRNGACVSLYMPTSRASTGIEHDRIMLRNLTRDSERRLPELGYRSPEAKRLLKPLQTLEKDKSFWRHQSDGLAIFLSRDMLRHYRLPINFKQLVVVSDRFNIKPLLAALTADNRFYVLAVSQNSIKFLQCTGYGAREVEVEGLPLSMADALRYEEASRQLHYHRTGTNPAYHSPPAAADRAKEFVLGHGQSIGDLKKEDITHFLQLVDKGLRDPLKDEKAPLLLAGVDFLLSIYKEVNSYPYTLDTCINGNPDGLSAEDLHRRARAIMQPYFDQARKKAVNWYREAVGTRHAVNDLKEIVLAAYDGRVDFLFVAEDQEKWGTFDTQARSVNFHARQEPGDEDLLDRAAVSALLSKGTVYLMKPEEMPDRMLATAVLRY